ncbi:MAG: archaellin/type IV pilin N-terminal domain-containing protein [Nanoarchaeota archaeon]
MNKKGLSPVIATVLLVSMAVIIAALIFMWAKGTIAERYLKFNEPVERSCENTNFDIEILRDGNVSAVNRGNVPIYGFKLFSQEVASITNLSDFTCLDNNYPITIRNGESCEGSTDALASGKNVLVVPVILAQRGKDNVPFTCDNSFGKTVGVI